MNNSFRVILTTENQNQQAYSQIERNRKIDTKRIWT